MMWLQSLKLFLAEVPASDVGLPKVAADDSGLQTVLNITFGVVTLLAVIYMMLTGFKLITMQGDPVGISKARQGLIFAAVGLVVVLFADAFVFFVLGWL